MFCSELPNRSRLALDPSSGTARGFCMPQVLGTMRSHTLDKEGKILSLWVAVGDQQWARWKTTTWLSSCPPAMLCKKSCKLPAEFLILGRAQAKVTLLQTNPSQGGEGPPQETALTPAPQHCAWWRKNNTIRAADYLRKQEAKRGLIRRGLQRHLS